MASSDGVEVAKAFVTILPAMPGIQKDIASAFNPAAANAGKQAGEKAGGGFKGAFGSGIKGVGGMFKSLAGVATAALGGIAFGSIVSGAVEASDATKKFANTLKFAGKQQDEVNDLINKTQKYADQTVYDLSDIQNMTAQLAANNVPDFEKLAEASGNLNAAAGGTAETFKSVGMVMTQTAGAGKLTTENWNQLADAIPGASGLLQEAMRKNGAYTGNFRDAMAQGQITAEEFNKAVMELGMNDGAIKAAKTTDTFEGAWGNMQASVNKAAVEIVNTAMPAITGALNWGADKVTQFADWFQKAWNGITDLVSSGSVNKELQDAFNIPDTAIGPITSAVWKVRNLWSGMIDFIKTGDFSREFNNAFLGVDQDTVDSIKDSLTGIRDPLKEFIESLKPLKKNLDDAKPSLDSFGSSVKILADTLKILQPVIEIIAKIGTAFNNLPAPIQTGIIEIGLFGWAIGKVVKPIANLVRGVGGFAKSVVGAFKTVAKAPGTAASAIGKFTGKLKDLKAWFELLPDYAKDFGSKITGMFGKLKGFKLPSWITKLGGAFKSIGDTVGKLAKSLGGLFGKLKGFKLPKALTDIVGKIGGKAGGLLGKAGGSLLGKVGGKLLGPVGAVLTGMSIGGFVGNKVGQGVSQLGKNTGNGLLQGAGDSLSTVSQAVGKFGDLDFKGSWDTLWSGAQDTAKKISPAMQDAKTGIQQTFSGMPEWFRTSVWQPIQQGGTSIWQTIQDSASAFAGSIGGFFSGIGSWFTQNVWTPISRNASDAWNGIVDSAADIPGNIESFFNSLGAWFQQNVWTPIGSFGQSMWTGLVTFIMGILGRIQQFFAGIGAWFTQNVWTPISTFGQNMWNTLMQFILSIPGRIQQFFANLANWFNQNVWQPIQNFANNSWNNITNLWKGIGTWWSTNVVNPLKGGLNDIGNAFNSTKDWISRSWDKIKEAAASPVRFVVNTVYNNGIRAVWDKVASAVGLGLRLPAAHFARGGVMPGYTPGRDVMMAAVSGGEAIMRPEFTRAMGKDWIYMMNRLARQGGPKAVRQAVAGGMPAFRDGGIMGSVKSTLGTIANGVMDFLTDPGAFVTKRIVTPVRNMVAGIGGGVIGRIVAQAPVKWAEALVGKAKDAIGSIGAGIGGAVSGMVTNFKASAGVAQWTPQVLTALAMLGQPASWLQTVLRRMNQESGGNPNAINNWDSNAKAGHPSQGLMQTIPSTFAAYAGPLRSRGILDPLANIYAGLNYAIHRYGSLAALNRPGGYALGGIVPMLANGGTVVRDGVAMVGEKGPELLHLPAGAQVRPLGTTVVNQSYRTETAGTSDDDRLVDALVTALERLPVVVTYSGARAAAIALAPAMSDEIGRLQMRGV